MRTTAARDVEMLLRELKPELTKHLAGLPRLTRNSIQSHLLLLQELESHNAATHSDEILIRRAQGAFAILDKLIMEFQPPKEADQVIRPPVTGLPTPSRMGRLP